MGNEHIVDYHPSPTGLTSRIHPFIFLWTPNESISPESFLTFFSNLYIPPWLRKIFKFIVLRLLENEFVCQKTKSITFYSCPQAKTLPRFLSSPTRQKEIIFQISSKKRFFEHLFFPKQKGRRIMKPILQPLRF